ncbi:NAD-dependent epimerase/dehydratase family protein [Paenibacillus xylanexedens]|uniref:NAD-dependent epimerase/dehydratase family protein n=1 Tax=Paenibacillus xylanexedens TaxID=528191 RepID=UPI003D08DCE5
MNIIISGAAGFLGSQLTERLLREGHNIIGIDNIITGTMSNLAPLLKYQNFLFMKQDVTNIKINEILSRIQRVDEVYHLASPASPLFYERYPLETIAVNTIGTRNLLELSKITQAKFLYTSTSEVYGDPMVSPQPESYNGNLQTWGPRACYDESKRLGEVYCYEYAKRYNVKVKIPRIFNTYSAGLRYDDGRVISNFIHQALSNQDLTVYGTGLQTRSFCYVDDTIEGLIQFMNSPVHSEIINIGNEEEYSILEIAKIIIELTQSNSKIVHLQAKECEPFRRKPDIRKAKEKLNWEPSINLYEGLKRTIREYKGK